MMLGNDSEPDIPPVPSARTERTLGAMNFHFATDDDAYVLFAVMTHDVLGRQRFSCVRMTSNGISQWDDSLSEYQFKS